MRDFRDGKPVPPVRMMPAQVEARGRAEAVRMAEMRARHTLPVKAGAVDFAPARGAMQLVRDMAVMPGGTRRMVGQHWERADVFDAMEQDAIRAHTRSGADGDAVMPLTEGQKAMGRHYRRLVENHAAGGVRCASLETRLDGGSGGGSFIDAWLAEGQEIDRLRARIGTGAAMVVRRVRPSARGAGASIVTDRALVDAVCLDGKTLSDVLSAHGWAQKAEHRATLRAALAAALDRMQGYDLRGATR